MPWARAGFAIPRALGDRLDLMDELPDTSTAVWHSEEFVHRWIEKVEGPEGSHGPQFRLMGELLPFDSQAAFTFLDLGAGTGPRHAGSSARTRRALQSLPTTPAR